MRPSIEKSALIVRASEGGKILMTRERGKSNFAFPGGKVDPGETVEETLTREIWEELNVAVLNARKLGTASGETLDGRKLTIHMYEGRLDGSPVAGGEIEILRWVSANDIAADVMDEFTPITKGPCMEILRASRIF